MSFMFIRIGTSKIDIQTVENCTILFNSRAFSAFFNFFGKILRLEEKLVLGLFTLQLPKLKYNSIPLYNSIPAQFKIFCLNIFQNCNNSKIYFRRIEK